MKFLSDEITTVIPSRYPMMILDSLEINEDKAVAEINLSKDIWFFKCHYPDQPMMPLMLLMESMTQVFMAVLLQKANKKDEIPLIYSLGEVHPKGMLLPGDKVKLEAELKSFKRVFAKGICRAYKNDEEEPILQFDIVDILPSIVSKIED